MFAGHQTAVGELPQHAVKEDKARREEGHGERDGREVLVAVPVAVQRRRRGAHVPSVDAQPARRRHCARQSGAACLGHRHLG